MRKAWIGFFGGLVAIATIALLAVVGGTIVFWIWPVATEPFIAQGVTWLPAVLSWWQAVTLTWLFGILIKSSQTNNNN